MNIVIRPFIALTQHIQCYFGLGPRYFYLHQHNHSSYVSANHTKNPFGFFVNTGFYFLPYKHLFFDFCSEYSWEKVCIANSSHSVYGRDIQVGGYSFEGGLGYAF